MILLARRVERYKGKVLAAEIMNEPNLMCEINSTGRIPAATIYARLLEEAYWAAKTADPDMPVIGLSVAGADVEFCREVMEIEPDALDIAGVHTYTSSRRIGADQRPLSPGKDGFTAGTFSS